MLNESIIKNDILKALNESKSVSKISWHDMLKKMEELGYDYTGDYSFIPEGYKRRQMLYRFDYNHKEGTRKLNIQEIKDVFDGNVTVFYGTSSYAPEQNYVLMSNRIFDANKN